VEVVDAKEDGVDAAEFHHCSLLRLVCVDLVVNICVIRRVEDLTALYCINWSFKKSPVIVHDAEGGMAHVLRHHICP
jgi:hypothetical protein